MRPCCPPARSATALPSGSVHRSLQQREGVRTVRNALRCSYVGSCGLRRTAGHSHAQPSWAWRHRLHSPRRGAPLCPLHASPSDDNRSSGNKDSEGKGSDGKDEAYCPPGEPRSHVHMLCAIVAYAHHL